MKTKLDPRFDHHVIVEFKDGRKFVRQNLSKKKTTAEIDRYIRDRLIFGIKSVKMGSK
jgi:hypothetical protein